MDIGPGDLVSARRENCCPSAGSHLSAHREDDVSAVSRCGVSLQREGGGLPAQHEALLPPLLGALLAMFMSGRDRDECLLRGLSS